jgi:biopolymer transport protein ExbD
MAIHTPGGHLGLSAKSKSTKKAFRKHGKKGVYTSLNLTPMIDMFVMLVIFLIMQFSASGEILYINKDVVLPKARTVAELQRAPVITITKEQIRFEDRIVQKVEDLKADDVFKSEELGKRLQEYKKSYETNNIQSLFKGEVILQGDSGVPFQIVKKVLNSCAASGFFTINYAVIADASGH